MAEFSLPRAGYNSGAVTDGEYELLTHPTGADGLVGTPADQPLVYGDSSGMQVKVRADRYALVRGRLWGSGGSEFAKTVGANSSGSTRIDLVILRLTRATPIVEIVVKAGTPGSGPPALTQDLGTTGVYEIPVAQVTVVDGASTIAAGNVSAVSYYLGELLVVCTSDTRPGHAPGRRIWETDTGREYLSTGTSWVRTYPVTADSPSTTNITPASGWSVAGGQFARVVRLSGIATLELVVSRTGAALGGNTESTILTIPSGYRSGNLRWESMWSSGSEPILLRHESGGALKTFGHNGLSTGHQIAGTATWVVG